MAFSGNGTGVKEGYGKGLRKGQDMVGVGTTSPGFALQASHRAQRSVWCLTVSLTTSLVRRNISCILGFRVAIALSHTFWSLHVVTVQYLWIV